MITVKRLLAALPGELHLAAGQAGSDRLISWAHVCDLPDPWSWVGPGDLVLTTGDGLPAEPAAQRQWFATLADVGIAGFVLAPRPGAPTASADLLGVAEERSIAVLTADFALQFSSVSRMVIENAVASERDHIHAARRLFDVYHEALRARADLSSRLEIVARSIGWAVAVTARENGAVLAAGGGGGTTSAAPITVPVPGHPTVEVTARPARQRTLDGSLVHYLAGLVGIELEHQARDRDERRHHGELVLRDVLEGAASAGLLREELARRGIHDDLVAVAVLRFPPEDDLARFDLTLPPTWTDAVPPTNHDGADLLMVIPWGWSCVEAFRAEVGPGAHLGVSLPLAPGSDIRDARLQARAAASHAIETRRAQSDYGELHQLGATGPRSLTEMRRLVERLLGPLLEQDRSNGTDLTGTLSSFLHHDRSWTRTAEELGVHRQTLVYRVNQIDKLTGRKVMSTAGTAELWTALRAALVLGIVPARHGPRRSDNAEP
ncbi:PucR family transcriptional regulator [Actinomycetospora termitidis]|uniref:PucR family transcriptional regulator n=1 Tax=Actinomycetospora termitidis TaxID=3053470 RepID=A0ABT7M6I6_9PSEU|nr:PucR family transcriptional regulator [Actinomycetospora sp. Odt1-22]MDL5156056.1 PucR family transcriptional regulator [Actinomycetospora sp. Odt1-22]